MLSDISSIRIRDLEIFIEVARARSIREAARRFNFTSGQVSKSVQGLERTVGAKLFRRSVSGVLLTAQGAELQVIVQDLLSSSEKISSLVSGRNKNKFSKIIALAATSFIHSHLSTPTACRLSKQWPNTVFRFMDLAPDQIVAVGLRGGFDIAIHYGALSWPGTWTTKKLGRSRWNLYAAADHDLPRQATLKQVLEFPFVVPTYWTTEGMVRGNDQFPIPASKRKSGFETATADAAIPIVIETEQIAFLPDLLVRKHVQAQQLKEIRVPELPLVEKELYLSAKSDSVPAQIFEALCREMAAAIK